MGSDEGRKESVYGICGLPIDHFVVIWELVEDEEESKKGDEM